MFPTVTAYMNVFLADRQNIPCRGPMPFEFMQPASMAANNTRKRDAVTLEGSRVPACWHSVVGKAVGCYVAHSGNFSGKVSRKIATPIIKHCVFYLFSK